MHFQPDNTYSGLLCVVHCLSASLSSNHSVQFSRSVVSDSPQPHELKHARPPSITNCQRSLKLMSIESLIPSTHLILCRPLLLLPPIPSLLAVQETLKSLFQRHSSKASILQCSAIFTVQLSHPYMTTGKAIALTRKTFIGKLMSLLFNIYLGWS